MAKSNQATKETTAEDSYLFAIGTPEGDIMVKIGVDGNILYLKEGSTLEEAAKAFWNSFELFLPITAEEVVGRPNDADLGAHVRARMNNKLGI